MAQFTVLGAVNDPGTPGKGGDDRYGFDEQAGTAWALDGATDVTDLRPFPRAESGAAWIAQAYSDRLISQPPPPGDLGAYWRDVFSDVRALAAKQTKIDLGDLPGEATPIAAGIWARVSGEMAEFCWLGDCVALVDAGKGTVETVGSPEKAEAETAEARRMNGLSDADKLAELQRQRASMNKDDRWVFGLVPDASDHMNTRTVQTPSGTEMLLMSDGFYRLISPYALHDPKNLFALVRDVGLLGAIRALRAHEAPSGGGDVTARIKRSDDACAVWLRVGD